LSTITQATNLDYYNQSLRSTLFRIGLGDYYFYILSAVIIAAGYYLYKKQNVLAAISETFKKQKITIADITSVEVVTGPGSFTGLRVGVSIVNALSYALKVPVNGRPAGSLIMPTYGKKPNIQSR